MIYYYRGTWNQEDVYNTGNVVSHNGQSFLCMKMNKHVSPKIEEIVFWELIINQKDLIFFGENFY